MSRLYLKKLCVVITCLLISVSAFTQDIKSLVRSGDIAVESGNYYGGAELFRKALQKKSNMPEVVFKMAEAYRMDNDYVKAAKAYKKLVPEFRDKFIYAEFYLAKMLKAQSEYLLAQYHFRNFLNYYSQNHDKDWYIIKADREIVACEKAQLLMFNPENWNIQHPDTSLNTYYADFTLDGKTDTILFMASILPDTISEFGFSSKIYQIVNGVKTALPEQINSPGIDVANPFFDFEQSKLYFTITDSLPTRICFSKLIDEKWQVPVLLPETVNSPEANSTQACVVHTDSLSYIIYASDKPGGMGGYDIYYNVFEGENQFSRPYNWGREVVSDSKFSFLKDTSKSEFNTPGNEISPFYHAIDTTLYFSSDWEMGMGEFDIFQMKARVGFTNTVLNMGFPVNSPQNDLYYRIDRANDRAYFTSNRNEAFAVKHQSCCNDVFYYDLPEMIIPKTEEEIVQEQVIVMTEQAVELIPISLFFDNDHPNPRTTDSITELTYEQAFQSYIDKEETYIKEFTAGLKDDAYFLARDSIEQFFEDSVNGEFQKLRKFMLLMEELLKRDQEIVMTIKGYTSPLNTPEYNLKLAKRRISSLENYIREYKNGIFMHAIHQGLLKIETVPFGETLVRKGVSDDPNDKRNSVYNPLAAAERKIEVIAIKVVDEI
jgi:tetratricopeptide (TPR) repeat protein